MINDKGLEIIKKYEGCVLHVYLDPVGIKTVGYGHTGTDVNKMKVGQTITQHDADEFLYRDIEKAELQVNLYKEYDWTPNEYSALVSFAFNVGNIKQLTAYGKRTKKEIADKILAYVYAGGNKLPGLVKRRQEEHDLFLTASKPVVKSNVPNYQVGTTYVVNASALAVRTKPSLTASLVPYNHLTISAQLHTNGKTSYLKCGTKVTCKSKLVDNEGNIWLQIPSGWVCAYLIGGDRLYVS